MSYGFLRTITLQTGHTASLQRAIFVHGTDWQVTVRGVAPPIAHAYSALHGDTLGLGDLRVERAVQLPHRHTLARLRGLTEVVVLRGPGLGSERLREVPQEVRRRGLTGITGRSAPEQAGDARTLTRFYTRHGVHFQGGTLMWRVDGISA